MKYENEINKMLNTAFPKESYMTDTEHQKLTDGILNLMGLDKQKLSEQIEEGVKNGYTVKQQINLLSIVLNKNKQQK